MSRKLHQCVRPCFFGGRLWEVGQTAMFEDGKWPKDKDGKIRHFELVGQPAEEPKKKQKKEEAASLVPNGEDGKPQGSKKAKK